MTPPVLTKRTDAGNAYYTVRWSPLEKVEKYTIIKRVPAMAGGHVGFQEDRRVACAHGTQFGNPLGGLPVRDA